MTHVSCERHGGLRASLEVLCQALIDSRHLSVCLELGLKLSSPPTWIEILSLLLRSLEAPSNGSRGRRLSSNDVSEVRILPMPCLRGLVSDRLLVDPDQRVSTRPSASTSTQCYTPPCPGGGRYVGLAHSRAGFLASIMSCCCRFATRSHWCSSQ